jgi:hypothetical protein
LSILIIGSFSFYTYAEENSITNKNIFLDSDQDGLSDSEERALSTDPNAADTDGDGYSDGAEVKSGYNPLKPAPGDRLIPEEKSASAREDSDPTKKNLTKEVTRKVTAVMQTAAAENKEISVEQVKSIVSESLNQEVSIEEELPVIDPKEIKIKKQNYAGLSKEKQLEKKTDDMSDYVAGLSYVFLSNSPEPINSNDDFIKLNSDVTAKIANAINTQDSSVIKELGTSLKKMTSQIKDIEVPEEIAEDHAKGLQMIRYASELEDALNPTENDPLTDLANYSKIQSLTVAISDFSDTVTNKLSQYNLKLDETMQGKMEDYGISVPANFIEKIK